MARGSALTVSVLMVFLDQKLSVLVDNSLDFVQSMNGNAAIIRQSYGIEPEFAILSLKSHVDVGGLVPFVGEEVKAVGCPIRKTVGMIFYIFPERRGHSWREAPASRN